MSLNENMPRRKTVLASGEYYHIFNRGVNHTPIFLSVRDYKRFLKTVLYYQGQEVKPRYSFYNPNIHNFTGKGKLVEIIAYCLMPNHFHFLLKQTIDKGIENFVRKSTNSYTKYFNIKNKRIGPLFQGRFQSVHIETNEQLLHLSRYIHLNPIVSYVARDLESYEWSSFKDYFSNLNICSKDVILKQFKSAEDYKNFLLDQENYAKELELIKHQLLD